MKVLLIILSLLFSTNAFPVGANIHFSKGITLKNKGKYKEASREFLSAYRLNPSWTEAVLEAAKALTIANKRKEASLLLVNYINKTKQQEDIAKLKKQLELITETFYKNATFQLYLDAKHLFKLGKKRIALEKIDIALKNEGSNVKLLFLAGKINISMGKKKFAGNYFSKAEKLNPFKSEANWLYAKLLYDLKKFSDSEGRLLRIDNMKGTEEYTLLLARSLFHQGKNEEAIKLLTKESEQYPNHIETIYLLGEINFIGIKNYWLARKHFLIYKKHCETMQKVKGNELYTLTNDFLKKIESELKT